MLRVKLKKIINLGIVFFILFSSSVAYATDVVIDNPTPDMNAPIIDEIQVSSTELSPNSPVKVIASITDELSGFSNGSITYTKSNNQTSSFPFYLNPNTNKYEATITVPSIGVPGEWKATSIYLNDKKENSIYINATTNQSNGEIIDFSSLHLNVTGVTPPPEPTDKEAPNLKGITVSSQLVTVNEKIEVIADVTDNESGVSTVYANYRSPSGKLKTISLRQNTDGKFIGSYLIGKYEESGDWTLTSVYINDKVGNSITFTNYKDLNNEIREFENCMVTVSGTTIDNEAPVLNEISVTSNLVKANERIEVKATVSDNESGVASVRATYKKPNGSLDYIYLYRNQTGQYVGSVVIGQYEDRGNRILTSVYLSDSVGNSKSITGYTDSTNNVKDFSHCTVEVTGTTPDWEGPEFTGGKISVQQISPTQAAVNLAIEVEDRLSGITYSLLSGSYRKPSGRSLNLNFKKSGNQYTATILIDKYDELGEYVLNNLLIRDAIGNYTRPIKIGDSPLSEFNFNVMGKISITPGTPNNIIVDGPSELLSSQTFQLNPLLGYTNGAIPEKDITTDPLTKYISSNPTLLTVNPQGLLTVPAGAGAGIVNLEVSYGNVRKDLEIKVNGGIIETILQVSPLSITLHSGQSEQLKVVELFDGARKDVTSSSSGISYTSTNPSLVTVSKDGLIQATSADVAGTATISMTYKGLIAKTTVRISKPVIKTLSISPLEEKLSLTNNKLQLVLKALMSDGTTKDITLGSSGTTYISSNNKIATVDGNGSVTIPSNAPSGIVTIKAINSNLITQATLSVDGVPELQKIQANPISLNMIANETTQLQVSAIYSDGSIKDITASSMGTEYITSNMARATVDLEGLVSIPISATPGTVTITVKNGTFQTTVPITVEKDISNDVLGLSVNPASITLLPRNTKQLEVVARMGDGTTKDVTSSSEGTTYVSSNPTRAIVSEEGFITVPDGASAGTVTITAINGIYKATTVVTVERDLSQEIISLSASPAQLTLSPNETKQLEVLAAMADGSVKNITSGLEGTKYTSSNTGRATVDNEGVVNIPSNATLGTVVITAKNGIYTASSTITVVKDPSTEVKSLSVNPPTIKLSPGDTQSLEVIAMMGDGNPKTLTASSNGTTYTSSNTGRATVNNEGVVSIPSNASLGTVVITAKNGIYTASSTITVVKDPSTEVKSLSVNPPTITLSPGATRSLEVIAMMGDGNPKTLTASSNGTTYTSSNTGRATVNNEGVVSIPSNASLGTVVITAKNGIYTASSTITVVKDPSTEVKSLSVNPPTITLSPGATRSLEVIAMMGDGNPKTLTASSNGTTYTSSNTGRATVDNEGVVNIPSNATLGTVVITAKNGIYTASSTITVVKDPSTEVKSISVNPPSITLSQGDTRSLEVIAMMGDGNPKTLTASSNGTTYTSSNTGRATVDSEGLVRIPLTATPGTVVITAKNGNHTASTMITVVNDPAAEIVNFYVTPKAATLSIGDVQSLEVTAIMGNGDVNLLTASTKGTTYISSNTGRATVDSEGVVSIPNTATAGTATITVTNGSHRYTVVLTIIN